MSSYRVVVVRYCADVAPVAAFYEALGLTRIINTDSDRFVTLLGGDGVLMLHAAHTAQNVSTAGLCELSFQTHDLDSAADDLAGLEPVRWDESYGQHLGVRDPRGDGIWIDEVQRDLYGYHAHSPAPNDLNIVAIRYSDDFAADASFFATFGLRARPGASEHFTALEANGVVGLHPPNGELPVGPNSPDNPVAPPLLVDLSLETREPLVDVQRRLSAVGITAQLVDGPAPNVVVTDPEGVEVQIHKRT